MSPKTITFKAPDGSTVQMDVTITPSTENDYWKGYRAGYKASRVNVARLEATIERMRNQLNKFVSLQR